MNHSPEKLTPRDFAKLRSEQTGTIVQPQNIYYYIRKGLLTLEDCQCGRKVLDVKLANEFFDLKEAKR